MSNLNSKIDRTNALLEKILACMESAPKYQLPILVDEIPEPRPEEQPANGQEVAPIETKRRGWPKGKPRKSA